MKRITSILMLLSLVVGLNAQTDLYYTEGTEWEEEWFFENEETTMSDYRQFTVSGDTVVNGTTYKCVRCKVRVNDGATQDKLWDRSSPWHWEVIEGLPPILIREDGGKVYYYDGKKAHKAFELPQSDPEHNTRRLKSYNRPEFMVEPVKHSISDFRCIVEKE